MSYKSFDILLKEEIGKESVNKAIINVCSLVSKRISKKITVPNYSFDYTNSKGDFTGVTCPVGSTQAIRFNWKLNGNSANVDSISFWLSFKKSNPSLELDTSDVSLVKVVDIIANVLLTGETGDYTVLNEDINIISQTKGQVSQDIASTLSGWATDMFDGTNNFVKALSDYRMKDLFTNYMNWYNDLSETDLNKYKFVNQSTFLNYLGKYMNQNGIENKFSRKVQVSRASAEIMKVEKSKEKDFKDMLYHVTAEDKFKMLKAMVRSVAKGLRPGFMVIGKSGVGKSSAVVDVLEEEGVQYVPISGAVRNSRALFEILAKHNKKGLVILFDDSDSILKNKECVNILKSATDTTEAYGGKRIITFVDTKHTVGATKNKAQIVFESGIILIANLPKGKIDDALQSRLTPLEITMDKAEMLDYIKVNLEKVLPEIPLNYKTDVWDFINNEITNIRDIDFRRFMSAVAWRVSFEDNNAWKRVVYNELR